MATVSNVNHFYQVINWNTVTIYIRTKDYNNSCSQEAACYTAAERKLNLASKNCHDDSR